MIQFKASGMFCSRLSRTRRWHLVCAAACLLGGALVFAGCSRNANKMVAGNASITREMGNRANADNTTASVMSREEMKGMADKQGQATAPDKGNFRVVYADPKNEKYARMNEDLKQSGLLEKLADQLNATVAIPADVNITVKECGKVTAMWNPQERSINMCFEMMEDMTERLKPLAKISEQESSVRDALMFTLIHEVGHSLYDLLKLPPTGRSEDAVDQLVTYVLVDSASDEGEQMALGGAMWWERLYEEMARSGKTELVLDQGWAREHAFDAQRFYNVVCWVYGRNPAKYQSIVNDQLPEQRANHCPQEYAGLTSTWASQMKPYLKDGGANAEGESRRAEGER